AEAPVTIAVVSSRADLVSGGSAVVALTMPAGVQLSDLRVSLNGADVSNAFAARANGKIEGLVAGLHDGANELRASPPDGSGARLTLTDHPNGGPLFAGPQLQPWKCEA